MVSKLRAERIAERIYEELSTILLLEVSDPRLSSVSITDVSVDRELAFASIFVSSLEGSEVSDEILEGLNHAAGYLRRALAQRIHLRSFPRLRFIWDPIPERADKIDKLLDALPGLEMPPNPEQESSDPDE
jgi:ribosome-binding factor A